MTHSDSSWTVATYNIRLGIQRGLCAVAQTLCSSHRPQIAAVQEIGDHWEMGPSGNSCLRLSQELQLSHWVFAPTITRKNETPEPARYGHALFSMWPIRSHQVIALPRHDDEPRVLLRSVIDTPSAPIEVLSAHLSHRRSDRPEQGKFLVQWLRSNPSHQGARFVLGDLNATASEPFMSELLDLFTDADATAERPTFPESAPERRIDYILGQGVRLQSVDITTQSGASDHRAIISRWLHKPLP